jgi:hypothetical protein
MTAGAQNLLKIYSIDEFKLKHTSGGNLFYVKSSGMPISFESSIALDNLDGSYNSVIAPNQIGSCKIDVLRLTEGALLAEFFDGDPSLSSSLRLNIEMHNSINFESPFKHLSYSAVRWTGYLRPDLNMLHTLHVYATGGVRMWLDHKLVLNRTHIPSINGVAVPVSSSSIGAHEFIFEYMRLEPLVSVQLKWSSNAETLAIIPSRHFYHANHHAGSPISVPVLAGPVSSFSKLSGAVTLFTAGKLFCEYLM